MQLQLGQAYFAGFRLRICSGQLCRSALLQSLALRQLVLPLLRLPQCFETLRTLLTARLQLLLLGFQRRQLFGR